MLLFALSLCLPNSSFAYRTVTVWPPDVATRATYTVDPNVSSALGIVNAPAPIRAAAATWDGIGLFRFMEDATWNPNCNTIQTRNFALGIPCGTAGDTVAAVTCAQPRASGSGTVIAYIKTYYNTSGTFRWNTINKVGGTDGKDRDLQTTTTHEFGHWFALGEGNISGCTMTASNRSLCDDDKLGPNMLYGPYTGFDSGRSEGIPNYTTYHPNVTNHSLAIVGAENGVNSYYGTKMARIMGNADTLNSSGVYFKLFSIDKDASSQIGTTIPNGAHLRWCQYNVQQQTVSIDAYFKDGTNLRNYSNVIDQYGRGIHPSYRDYPLGGWYCFDFDLAPVVRKVALHWYIAYDNSLTGGTSRIGSALSGNQIASTTGPFKAYIDSIKFTFFNTRQ